MVGLPGTGLGGLFYILLSLWVAAREFLLAFRRQSSRERWEEIAYLVAIAGGIVGALWLEALAIRAGLQWLASSPGIGGAAGPGNAHWGLAEGLAPALAALPVVILAVMLISLAIANRLIRAKDDSQLNMTEVEIEFAEQVPLSTENFSRPDLSVRPAQSSRY